MFKKLLFLLLLISCNAQSMDLTKYTSDSIKNSANLYYAIKRNDYNAIYHFCRTGHILDDYYDPQTLKRLCSENIKNKSQNLNSTLQGSALTYLGTITTSLGAYFEYYRAFGNYPKSEWEDLVLSLCNTALLGMGGLSLYAGLTNYPQKHSYKNALAIKQLLIEKGFISAIQNDNAEHVDNGDNAV